MRVYNGAVDDCETVELPTHVDSGELALSIHRQGLSWRLFYCAAVKSDDRYGTKEYRVRIFDTQDDGEEVDYDYSEADFVEVVHFKYNRWLIVTFERKS